MANDFSSSDLPNGLFPLALNHHSLRGDYEDVLAYLKENAPPFQSQRGKSNPYTGATIRSQRDYDEYLRQHALRLVYEKTFAESKFGELYLASKDDFEQQLAVIDSERSRLADANHAKDAEIEDLKHNMERSTSKLSRLTAAVVLLVAALLLGCFKVLPDARRTGYNNGESIGYSSGYSAGYDSGRAFGYKSGKADGYNEGHAAGKDEGYNSGLAAGRTQASASLPSLSSGPSRSQVPPLGESSTQTVYVSRNGIYHQYDNCSGMQYYTEMALAEAEQNPNYRRCSKCW